MTAGADVVEPMDDGGLMFECPGCQSPHLVRVGKGAGPRWEFNGDRVRPTLKPSILVRWSTLSEAAIERNRVFHEKHGRHMTDKELPYDQHHVCHSYVTDGRIQFLRDSTHPLAGQTVDLPPVEP